MICVRLKASGDEIMLPSNAATYPLPRDFDLDSGRAGYDPELGILSYRCDSAELGADTLRMTRLGAPCPLVIRTVTEAFLVAVADVVPEHLDDALDALLPLWVASVATLTLRVG